MRVLGRRWGWVVVIVGLSVLGRGLAKGNVVGMSVGPTLVAIGIGFWACLHYNVPWRRMG